MSMRDMHATTRFSAKLRQGGRGRGNVVGGVNEEGKEYGVVSGRGNGLGADHDMS